MFVYILMYCAWLIATVTACFTFWQWRICQRKNDALQRKNEELQHRCVWLSLQCGEKYTAIRKLIVKVKQLEEGIQELRNRYTMLR